MDQSSSNEPNCTQGTEVHQMDGNGMKWTVLDQSGLNRLKWIEMEQSGPNWTEMDPIG